MSFACRCAPPTGATIRACLTLVVFIVSLSSFDALVLCTQSSLVLVVLALCSTMHLVPPVVIFDVACVLVGTRVAFM